MIRSSVFSLLSVLVLTSWTPCKAVDVIIADNLGNTNTGSRTVTNSTWRSQQFTTTAGGYVVSKVVLPLYRSAVAMTGNYDVAIYSVSAGLPGSQVYSVSTLASSLSTTTANQTFNVSWALSPNTSYYLVVKGNGLSGGDVRWDFTEDTSGTGFPSTYARTLNSGGLWNNTSLFDPQLMQITAVPEPSTYVLSLVTVGMFAVAAKRKRNRNSKTQV